MEEQNLKLQESRPLLQSCCYRKYGLFKTNLKNIEYGTK